MKFFQSSFDLVLALLLTFLAALAALIPLPTLVLTGLVVPVIFVLPGYILAATFRPRGAGDTAERLVFVVALSLATTVLTGLVTSVLTDLDRATWAVALMAVTAALGLVAVIVGRADARSAVAWALPSLGSVTCIGAAVVLTAGALAISSAGAEDSRTESRFTELWILPGPSGSTGPGVSVGVESHEGRSSSVSLRVLQGKSELLSRRLELADDESWTEDVPLEGLDDGGVRAVLSRDGTVYRRVDLAASQVRGLEG